MALIAHWPLNGNLDDISGNDNNSTANGALNVGNTGKIGQCFTTAGGRIESGLSDFNHSWTVMGWWRFNGATWAYSCAFAGTRNSTLGWMLYRNSGDGNGYLRWYMHYNTTSDTVSEYYAWPGISGLEIGRWYHIAITRDMDGNSNLYLDGVLYQARTKPANWKSWRLGNLLEILGGGSDGWASSVVSGNDYRVYDEVLSEKEIYLISRAKIAHYTFNTPEEPTENLIGSNGFGDVTWSSYSNGNDGTFITEFGTVGYQMKKRASWNGVYKSFTLPSTGTYTFSAWFRYLDGTTPNNGATVYINGHGSSDTSVSIDKTKVGQWQRISHTIVVTDVTINFYLISYGGSSETDWSSWEVTMPQIELKNHLTEYTPGERIDTVSDSSGYSNHGVFVNPYPNAKWVKDPGMGSGAYYFSGDADTTYIEFPITNIPYLNSVSISFWRKNDTTITHWLPFTGQSGSYYIMATSSGTGGFYHGNIGSSWEIFKDGVPQGVGVAATPFTDQEWHHYTITNVNLSVWTVFRLNSYGSPWKNEGYFSDIRMYAGILSDEDVYSLYAQKASVEDKGSFHINELDTHYDSYNEDLINTFNIYTYPYPEQIRGIYLNGTQQFNYGRAWQITVWDRLTGTWATDIDFHSPTEYVSTSHAIYDTYDGAVRSQEQQAFADTLYSLKSNHIVIIGASHAPEHFDTRMAEAIKYCGGSTKNLSWAGTRKSYICVGIPGIGEGNAIIEVLDSATDTANADKLYAKANFRATKEKINVNENSIGDFTSISNVGIADASLSAYYPLKNISEDYSGNAYDCTDTNIIYTGESAIFNGASSEITLPYGDNINPSTTHISFSLMVKKTAAIDTIFFTTSQNGDANARMYIRSGTNNGIGMGIQTSSTGGTENEASLPLGEWHHIAITMDGSNARLYLDGNLVGSNGTKSYTSYVFNENIAIGNHDSSYWLSGEVKNVKVFNRSLTAEEVAIEAQIMNSDRKMKLHDDGTLYILGDIIEGL